MIKSKLIYIIIENVRCVSDHKVYTKYKEAKNVLNDTFLFKYVVKTVAPITWNDGSSKSINQFDKYMLQE
jgi:hypothetical protein